MFHELFRVGALRASFAYAAASASNRKASVLKGLHTGGCPLQQARFYHLSEAGDRSRTLSIKFYGE